MLEETNEITPHEKYNRIECAKGSAFKRHNFLRTDESLESEGKADYYHSVFIHSKDIIDYYQTHKNADGSNTLAGYSGKVWTDTVLIDFDVNEERDLEKLQEDVRKFLNHLKYNYELNLNYIVINFSGKKGFHIRIPSILFGEFIPSEKLPSQIKKIVLELAGDIRIDDSFYHHTGLFRFVNSRNSKSGLCAIPLTPNEMFSLSVDEIKVLAESPRPLLPFPVDELSPNEELVKLKEKNLSTRLKVNFNVEADSIWQGVGEGNRNKALASLVGYLISKRVSASRILSIALLWNKACTPAEDEKTVKTHVESLLRAFATRENSFWRIEPDKKITFSLVEYRKYLEGEGFAKIYLSNEYIFVRIMNSRITEVSLSQIKDHVLDYIRRVETPHQEEIEEVMLQKNSSILGENMIECITTLKPEFYADEAGCAHFFFSNNIIKVTRDGISQIEYGADAGLVWDGQIINKKFTPVDIHTKSVFEKFIFNVAGQDKDCYKSFQSAIGYLLHSYKDSSNAKVVVLCDQKVTEFPDGRTGKSLFGKAISKVRKSVRIDGKNFDFNSRFTFQQVDLDTQVLEFNDVKKDFDFENLFSVVTDDMIVENKGQRPFVISFEKSPKILASTNFTIRGMGSSFRDRLFEIEFSDFYNEQHRPMDDFRKRFFDEWDEEEWNRFYSFMFECVRVYLSDGLVYPKNQNLQLRKLIDSTSREFIEYMEEKDVSNGINKKVFFDEFQKRYPDYLWLRQNTFSKWLKAYSNLKSLKLYEHRSNGQTIIFIKV